MHRIFSLVGLAGIVAGVALAAAVAAAPAKVELPPPDPPGKWRQITQEDRNTTSRCIGRTDSPVCAMETLLACLARQIVALCRMADDLDTPRTMEVDDALYTNYKFRIRSAKQLSAADVEETLSNTTYHHGPTDDDETQGVGDVMIVIDILECHADNKKRPFHSCTGKDAPPTRVYARFLNGHWVARIAWPMW